MGSPAGTPEAIVGLDLEGRGFDEVNQALDKHLKGWEAVEGHTTRIGQKIEGIAGGIGKLAGLTSIGGLVYDFVRLEDVANRVAGQMDRITGGRSGFIDTRKALSTAAIATSTDSRELGAAIASAVQRVGPQGVDVGRLARTYGTYSQAYGIDIGALESATSDVALFQRQKLSSSDQILSQIATQARKAGMPGQTGLYLSTVSGLVSSLIGAHPGAAGPGAANRVGAMYGAVQAGNPIFRDPALFGAGMAGVDQAVSQAYTNPRMSAMLNMAGISYQQSRNGLAGPGGRDMAGKILSFADRMYGHGSTEEDIFLRSNFGDVSADMLKAFSAGKVTYKELLNGHGQAATAAATKRRAAQSEQTAASRAQKVREGAGKAVGGGLDGVLGFLNDIGVNDVGSLAEAAGGYLVGKTLIKHGARRGFRRIKARHATDAAKAAEEEAAKQAEKHTGTRAAAEAVEHAATHGGVEAAAKAGAEGLLRKGGGPATAAGFFLFDMLNGKGSLGDRLGNATNGLLFGIPGLLSKSPYPVQGRPRAHAPSMAPSDAHGVGYDPRLDGYPDGGATTAPGRPDNSARFGRAVSKFDEAVDKLTRGSSSGSGGSLDAAGVGSSLGDVFGRSMVLSRMVAGGGGSGGGTSLASTQLAALGLASGGTGGGGTLAGGGLAKINRIFAKDGGATLTERQVRAAYENAGFSPGRALQMTLIAKGESGWQPGNMNDGGDGGTGLSQITPTDAAWGVGWQHTALGRKFFELGGYAGMRNPINNAKMAKFMFDHGGFGPWKRTKYWEQAQHVDVASVHSVLSHHSRKRQHKPKPSTTSLHPTAHLAWLGGGTAAHGGGGDRGDIIVNIDGHEIDRHRRLVRGRA